jgi:3-hydroxymyristoyl/3-hydroxydecanoyl-(acyl carrier protein) dehydratase
MATEITTETELTAAKTTLDINDILRILPHRYPFLLMTEVDDRDGKLMVFTGIERARFRRPVVPGDQLRIEVEVKAWRVTAVRMEGKAFVGDKRVAEATVTCQLVDRSRTRRSESGDDNAQLRT